MSQEDYSKNGMQTRVWGPAGWIFLHCIAHNYPQSPTQEQRDSYSQFFRLIGFVLPCRYCRESYQEYINQPGTLLNDQVMENRETFSKWLYDVHNKINKKLGIKDCITFKQIKEKYESFRSKCTKSSPIKTVINGCTNPPKEGSLRKKCEIKIIDIDENGNRLTRFGKPTRKNVKNTKHVKQVKLINLKKSNKQGKKYMATFTFEKGGRTKIIHFGAAGMSDFTRNKDIKRKHRYILRHRKDLKTRNPIRAGYLSMFILWNKQNLQSSIRDYKRRLNIYNRTGKFPINIIN